MLRRALLIGCLLLPTGCSKLSSMFAAEPTREQQAQAALAAAETAAENGEVETARQQYEKAAALMPNDSAPSLALGRLYAQSGNDGQAIMALKRAAELAPLDPEPRTVLAELYMRQGRPDMALEQLRKAGDGEDGAGAPAELQRKLVTAQLRLGELDEAEVIIDRLYREDPSNPDTLALYAEVLLARGEEERAVRLLDAAVAASGDSVRVRTARARSFYSRGKVNEAIREFDLAVQAAPSDPDAAIARARALATAGQPEDAKAAMDALVAARPTDLRVQAVQAEIKLLVGDVDGALDAAEGVLARQPTNGKALYVRARAVERNVEQAGGDLTRAINAYREVIEAHPGQAEALGRLWRLYQKSGDRNGAMVALEHLLMLGETTPDEEVELAEMYAKTGVNTGRGLRLINAALQRMPGEPRFLQIRAELTKKHKPPGPKGPVILRGGR